MKRCLITLSLPFVLAAAAPTDVPQPGRYEVTARTVLPHLDEMRRLSETERVCVRGGRAEGLFPVMRQPALRGCGLTGRAANLTLDCGVRLGASGRATIKTDGVVLRGALHVKMGGKNMTFSQFIEARRLGACAAEVD